MIAPVEMFAVTLEGAARTVALRGVRIAIIIAVGIVVVWSARRAIQRTIARAASRLSSTEIDGTTRGAARLETLASIMRSLVSVVVFTICALMVLGELKINLGPLLAGAGIAGIAIGFGAQSLVKDVLAGFFVMMEDQYGVGDVIDAGVAVGTVERMTLRSTQLRDASGTVWHIPNGSISQVGNRSQHWGRATVDVVVSHSADVRDARATMRRVAESMAAEDEWHVAMRVGEDVEDQGVSALTPMGVTLRVVVETEPHSKLAVERELRMRIKEAFDAEGIPLEVHQSIPPLP